MAHTELDLAERGIIQKMLRAGVAIARIAERLGRHRSTIYREIKRNYFTDEEWPEISDYYGKLAQDMARERRARRKKLFRLKALRDDIVKHLQEGWSPEQIAGRLKYQGSSAYVCHETIYSLVYSKFGQAEELGKHLSRRQKKRKPRYARKPRDLIFPHENSISNRPAEIATRETFGHWEGDLMIFSRAQSGEMNVVSLVERKTRYAVLLRNLDRRSKALMNRLIELFSPLPRDVRQSITFDRGFEFVSWRELKIGMGTEAWFCDPQAPWQKGSVENLNKRARRYLPRETNLREVSERTVFAVAETLNSTPRKCLGYRTPAEAFREELRCVIFGEDCRNAV